MNPKLCGVVWQARTALVVVGVTSLYMTARLELRPMFRSVEFWWMHAMICFWLLFAIILFIAEPVISRRAGAVPASGQSAKRLAWLQRTVSLVSIAEPMAGRKGW